jgi:hypothetical protein
MQGEDSRYLVTAIRYQCYIVKLALVPAQGVPSAEDEKNAQSSMGNC